MMNGQKLSSKVWKAFVCSALIQPPDVSVAKGLNFITI